MLNFKLILLLHSDPKLVHLLLTIELLLVEGFLQPVDVSVLLDDLRL